MTKATDCQVAVFAKAPRPGEVKTRLIPLLGPDGAAALQRRLIEHALGTALAAEIGSIGLWCSPNSNDLLLQKAADLVSASLFDQGDGDLGKRMARAFEIMLAQAPRCLLIGSDCPSLTAQDLKDAAAALDRNDVVLGPAEDGGYVLIGIKRESILDVQRLFDGIHWGTDTVLESTRQRVKAQGARWRELATRWDVDRPDDYLRLRREMPMIAMI